MSNKIFYNPEGYIEVQLEGTQSYLSFEQIQPTALDILDKLQARGQKRLGLIDVTKQGNFTPATDRAALEILEPINYHRLAFFGAGRVLQGVTKEIITAMGKSDNTQLFPDRESAVSWLLSTPELEV